MSFVVTIDGPAAAGKSTTARAVAGRLAFLYVDTGALYRALAFKLQRQGGTPEDPAAVERVLAGTRLDLSGVPDHAHVWLDGEDVADRIRTPEVSDLSSRLAALSVVRRWLVSIQRSLRERGPLVAEGRDLGTVVFPDADVKIYLDAAPQVRARRRTLELAGRGLSVELGQVLAEIERRDERDRTRSDSPLRPADGAVLVESSGKDVAAVLDEVLAAIRSHPRFPGARPPSGRDPESGGSHGIGPDRRSSGAPPADRAG